MHHNRLVTSTSVPALLAPDLEALLKTVDKLLRTAMASALASADPEHQAEIVRLLRQREENGVKTTRGPPPLEDELLDSRALRRLLGVHRATIWRHVKAKRLPAPIRIMPNVLRWRRSELLEAINHFAAQRSKGPDYGASTET